MPNAVIWTSALSIIRYFCQQRAEIMSQLGSQEAPEFDAVSCTWPWRCFMSSPPSNEVVYPSAILVCGVTHFSHLILLFARSPITNPTAPPPPLPGGPVATLSPDPQYLIRMGEGPHTVGAGSWSSASSALCQPVNVRPPLCTHFQILHSFNSLLLPDVRRLSYRRSRQQMPTFLPLYGMFCHPWLEPRVSEENGCCLLSLWCAKLSALQNAINGWLIAYESISAQFRQMLTAFADC